MLSNLYLYVKSFYPLSGLGFNLIYTIDAPREFSSYTFVCAFASWSVCCFHNHILGHLLFSTCTSYNIIMFRDHLLFYLVLIIVWYPISAP